jgi:DNA-binding winged helix-turn-helix (wHTH) protein
MRLRFAEFTLDLERRLLLRGEVAAHLAPKAFDLLALLVRRRPEALSKQAIFTELWPATFVTDNVLATLVTDIRAALGDDARQPRFIRTVHGFGYGFVGTIEGDVKPLQEKPAARWFLVWNHRQIDLADGENILGRRGDEVIAIDAPTVSKRHARLVVRDDGATIEDLQSKNGTWLGDRAVSAAVALKDGDQVRLGGLLLTVCRSSTATSTATASTRARRKS